MIALRAVSGPDDPVIVEVAAEVLSLTLARPKGNVLDRAMLAALRGAIEEHGRARSLKAILLAAEGPSFSYGASVAEHAPEQAPAMIESLHGLFCALLDLEVPCVAAVRGSCLGGAMELVLLATFVAAAPDARFGQPEIGLGVFAPLASALLPWKIGMAHAERLLISGASIDAARAQAVGLVDVIDAEPEARAHRLIAEHLLPKSASSLRLAVRAARASVRVGLDEVLRHLERLYLDELMATEDAREGIAAFLDKRAPRWSDR